MGRICDQTLYPNGTKESIRKNPGWIANSLYIHIIRTDAPESMRQFANRVIFILIVSSKTQKPGDSNLFIDIFMNT